MSRLSSLLYPPLQWVQRHTVRRGYLREMRYQQRIHALPASEQWKLSFARAVEYANRMVFLSDGFRERMEAAGIGLPIETSAVSWQKLPIINKTDFRSDPNRWYGKVDDPESLIWCWTSGSTGEPFKFPHTKESSRSEVARYELYLRALGWQPHWAMATIKVEVPPLKGLRRIIRGIMGNTPIGIAAAEFQRDRVPEYVERLKTAHIQYLRGYSTSVYLLADEILRRGLQIHLPLITSLGEALTESQAETVERAFGGKVYRDYGGSEAMHVGFECREQRGYHLDLSRFFIELVDQGRVVGPGETGEIVVTYFRNNAMPLVRYRIGDLGVWETSSYACPCGAQTPLLSRIAGRVADTVITSTGHLINVPLLVVVFEYAQEHISQFKVIQLEPTLFEVKWVARHDKAHEQIETLNRQLVEKTGGSARFRWTQVDRIPPEPSGKCRILVPLGRSA